jgi:hypothetical protein
MTAQVIRAFTHEYNQAAVARQEYELACHHYDDVCKRFTAVSMGGIKEMRDARRRRDAAFKRYMATL